MKIIRQVAEDILLMGCARCNYSGKLHRKTMLTRGRTKRVIKSIVPCAVCDGNGEFLVQAPNGQVLTCKRCDGLGRYRAVNGREYVCPKCRGVGGVRIDRQQFKKLPWANVPLNSLSEPKAAEVDAPAGSLRVVVFTNVEASTALTDELGDNAARAVLKDAERITRKILAEHGGAEIKAMGDGFMISFVGSVSSALDFAIGLQTAVAKRNKSSDHPVLVCTGISAGEPIEEEGDLFGSAVILAARLASKADGGHILVASHIRELVRGKDYEFEYLGAKRYKGFSEKAGTYELLWADD